MPASRAALGFSPHSGWACVVALAGRIDAPAVVARGRLDLSGPSVPVQPYHAARGLSLPQAEALVRRTREVAQERAAAGVGGILADLRAAGHQVADACIPGGGTAVPPSLASILASHPLAHAAEGELFRSALLDAASGHGLSVLYLPARELPARARTVLGRDEGALREALAAMGRAVGPPWRRDEREAALAAWLALASA